ncbi:restriction endonuclease subunit S [Aliarcobacter butzleri]|uniref:restriction endonuclease subunit S n=1 Tax=Aliarcobacter butzleri TaxID=28197 RepID=UPI002B2412B7|nr:restriction endonuclease subunit S [Aliarcobacter butzleri]
MGKLEKYSSYKDSGVEWLGEIPEHWEVQRLRTLGVFSASGIDKYINKNETIVKIINFTDVYSNIKRVLNNTIDFMEVTTPENNRKKHLVKKGDLIFLPSSETYEDLGLSALVDEELDNTSFSYHVIRFQFKKDIVHSFRKYLTNNNFVSSQFSSYGKGTTRKIIGRNVFNNIRIVLPPKEEQEKIATFLDEKTAQIDEVISQKEKLIELLKERKQIVINDAVTKGLDKDVEFVDSGVEWIGKIPKHWQISKVKNIFKLIIEPVPKANEEELLSIYTDIGVRPRKELAEKGNKASTTDGYWRVKKGDFIVNKLLAWMGAIGLSEYEGVTSPAYDILRAKKDIIGIYYHELFRLKVFSQEMKKYSRGIMDMRLRLYFDKFGDILIPYPSYDEQIKIVEYIENQTTKIDNAIELQQNYISKLKEYKASLIDSVVTGKVRVV